MRSWSYSWKSSDGLRHEGEMSAPSKDEVYAELRRQGIRAIRVDERIAPVVRKGLRGLRKRDWSIIAVVVVALIAIAVFSTRSGSSPQALQARDARPLRTGIKPNVVGPQLGDHIATARPRHCFDFPTNALKTIFRHQSEIWLARFARPGVAVEDTALPDGFADDLLDALDDPIVILAEDPKPIIDLKRVVVGMKEEAAIVLGSGKSAEGFADYVKARQGMELSWRLDIERKVREGKITREMAEKEVSIFL